MAEQTPYLPPKFVPPDLDRIPDEGEQRTPCVLLLDVSDSMSGEPIAEMNAGLQSYKNALAADNMACKRVDIAVVTFGGVVTTVSEFTRAIDGFNPPVLAPRGGTPMGAALNHAMDMIKKRKDIYRINGTPYTRPWLFLITDGEPNDEWRSAASRVRQEEEARAFVLYAVGVEGANFDVLRQISTARPPLKLKGLAFGELFKWLSASQKAASHSKPGEGVPISNPTDPGGWGLIPG